MIGDEELCCAIILRWSGVSWAEHIHELTNASCSISSTNWSFAIVYSIFVLQLLSYELLDLHLNKGFQSSSISIVLCHVL